MSERVLKGQEAVIKAALAAWKRGERFVYYRGRGCDKSVTRRALAEALAREAKDA